MKRNTTIWSAESCHEIKATDISTVANCRTLHGTFLHDVVILSFDMAKTEKLSFRSYRG